ncbi:unnamed protein product [Oikopleura dioica]|uniref:Uncharacterized protein n=1 Tax=Oikopleura dioica TaxID=34765 RepID=E4XD25_OIKDI|nr:unnamed protein product [Oikopleura dioica]
MEKLHGKSHFGNHSMPKIEKEPSSLKKQSVKSRSEIPSYKEQNFKLDDTVDLMEELLGNPTPRQPKKEPTRTSIYSTGRKSSVGNASSVSSSYRARPEKRTSVAKSTVTKYGTMFSDDDGVDSDDDLISDILAQKKPGQKPMKAAIASDLDELLGLGNGDDELDDLENLLTHGAGKSSKQSKSKTDAYLTTKMNPRKVVRPAPSDKQKLQKKTGSNWQFDFSPDSPSLDLGSLSKENVGRIEKPAKLVPNKRLTPRDHYLQSARYLPSSGAGSRIPPPSTINQNQNSNNSSHSNSNHSGWRYGNTAPSILPLRSNQQRRNPLPQLMPGLGRTNWAAKYR